MAKIQIGNDIISIVRNLEGQYENLKAQLTTEWPGTATNAAAGQSIEILRQQQLKTLAAIKRIIDILQS